VIGLARHLNEDRLYECYLAAATGDTVDPRAAEHLADCAECHARYAELSTFMGSLRTEGDAEVEALFSAEALRAQQSSITRRLEHLGHAARVISFPRHTPGSVDGGRSIGIAPRWLAAAAAAGLFVGVGVGSFFQVPAFRHARPAVVTTAPAPPATEPRAATPAPEPTPVSVPASEERNDELLAEIESVLQRPRTNALYAFDDFTPRVAQVSLTTRVQ
jgi:hypothetical protein